MIIDKVFKGYATRRYKLKEEQLAFISIGVDLDNFRNFGFVNPTSTHQEINILSIGHVIPIRSRVSLIQALPSVLKQYPNTKVIIVGEVYYSEVIELAEKLGVFKNIKLVGAVPSRDIPKLLEVATLEIHDVQGYGIGIASLEAMLAGVPTVMSTDLDYFPHAPLEPGKHFIQTSANNSEELAKSILRALQNPESLETISRAGREYVLRNFDFKKVAREHLLLFDKLNS
jgi:glycosyltransferase involved in cell wall biosynthesis